MKPENIQTRAFSFNVATLERQGEEWVIKKHQQEKEVLIEPLSKDVELEIIEIPAGTFLMGSLENELGRYDDEGPQHEVKIAPFYMAKYPVTQAQWQVVAGWKSVERDLDPEPSYFKGHERPVEKVSWYDAIEFCARLSRYTGKDYRLPTEAEWEYACRAGTTTPFHFGETISTELANYDGNYAYGDSPKGECRNETTKVGQFEVANNFGLYDMHGNVWEWCYDDWHENYQGAPNDGSSWLGKGIVKVIRGGSWYYDPWFCRCASRLNLNAGSRSPDLGFRLARSSPRTL